MPEKIIVTVVVATAFVYVMWTLVPATTRLRLARRLVAATGGESADGALARLAARLEKAAGGGSHCTGCDAHGDQPAVQPRQRK